MMDSVVKEMMAGVIMQCTDGIASAMREGHTTMSFSGEIENYNGSFAVRKRKFYDIFGKFIVDAFNSEEELPNASLDPVNAHIIFEWSHLEDDDGDFE